MLRLEGSNANPMSIESFVANSRRRGAEVTYWLFVREIFRTDYCNSKGKGTAGCEYYYNSEKIETA